MRWTFLILLGMTLFGQPHPASAQRLEPTACHSESLLGEIAHLAHQDAHIPNPTTRRAIRKADSQSWRKIDIIVDIPREYSAAFQNEDGIDSEALSAQVRSTFALAEEYFRPLKLLLNIVHIEVIEANEEDPYQEAYEKRDSFEMLKSGISRWDNRESIEHDLVVIFGSQHYRGGSGLAYTATSCVLPRYSVLFATQGGDTPMHIYTHSQTLAHEIGHFIGMPHDKAKYHDGPSMMWPTFVQYASAFSESSYDKALEHMGPGLAGGSCFEKVEDSRIVNDTDGDGASDSREYDANTDPTDPGSVPASLNDPVYASWNSFLGILNILELINQNSEDSYATISLFALDGSLLHKETLRIAAFDQLDVIINDLPGFVLNSYGLLKISFSDSIDGRMSYYRRDSEGQDHEFAYSQPLLNPTFGKTAVGFNTFNPNSGIDKKAAPVENWLSIINLSEEIKLFGIYSFDNEGRVLKTRTAYVPAQGRIDIDGGHGLFGTSAVGFHEIVPFDPLAPYMAKLVRYGSRTDVDSGSKEYFFAFPLIARAGQGRPSSLFISKAVPGEENWLELINTRTGSVSAQLIFSKNNGETIAQLDLELPPHEQQHIDVTSILRGDGAEDGHVLIIPDTKNSILAQNMFYFRNPKSGNVTSVFGSQSQEALGTELAGSYNTFLNMENWLRLANNSSIETEAIIQVHSTNGIQERRFLLPPYGSKTLALHEESLFSVSGQHYGLVAVTSSVPNALTGSVVRIRKSQGGVDFALPTSLW